MPPIEESVTSSFASKEPQDDSKPLWRFVTVTVVQNNDSAGGNKLWRCNFCQKEVRSSYFRARFHLLKIAGEGVQVCSSSCSEKNWSTYSFIYSLKRNKMDPKRVEDVVYAHDLLDCVGIELAELSLDESELETTMFFDDGNGGEETDTILVSS
ncbi:hypothetical protein MTR_4g130640 [Medicago truncatula]|uniref:BED-type domain-containing protein n=2 Tax=Medicago truncatula TaxID=3880 RepID=G7JFL0_MEDTR|nr:hypothetical protein MTR_4g130640 [Medicago truncatula]